MLMAALMPVLGAGNIFAAERCGWDNFVGHTSPDRTAGHASDDASHHDGETGGESHCPQRHGLLPCMAGGAPASMTEFGSIRQVNELRIAETPVFRDPQRLESRHSRPEPPPPKS
jgi:hypothetical protein